LDGFKKFLMRGNVLDLAVAVITGAAFAAIIGALVKGIITPFIGMFGGIPDFSAWVITINNSNFLIGEFVNAVFYFVIVAAILYFMVISPVNRLQAMTARQEAAAPPTTKECPECLSKVPSRPRSACTAPAH